jgi:hypothetical protein
MHRNNPEIRFFKLRVKLHPLLHLKSKQILQMMLLALFTLASTLDVVATTASAPAAGDGSALNPYEISSLDNLFWIAENSTRWDFHYVQTTDIDASATVNWFAGAGWIPVGTESVKFTGSYDGRGHKIENLYINRTNQSNTGLFGAVSGATLSHLHVLNANITGGINWTGILAGKAESGTQVLHCHTSGEVFGTARVGGLIGYVHGSATLITKSSSVATVTGNSSDSGSMYIGGLVGLIASSAATTESFATGDVTGRYRVGGLIGAIGWNALAENCYATGNVTMTNTLSEIGGLVGEVWKGRIRFCYSVGEINRGPATSGYGGLVGVANTDNPFEDHRNYWNTTTSGQNSSAMGQGLSTWQMRNSSNYSGWIFSTIWDRDNSNDYNNGFPVLRQPGPSAFAGGNGSQANPFLISNIYQLQALQNESNSVYARIINNFGAHVTPVWDLGGGFNPIGYFNGSFSGDNHSVTGLFINRPASSQVALFTYSGPDAVFQDLIIKDIQISGGSNTGSVVGVLQGTIQEITVSGTIQGSSPVGGLHGTVNSSGVVSGIILDVDVVGTGNTVGGLVGWNNGANITDCSVKGQVNGEGRVGGLVGYNGYTGTLVSLCHTDVVVNGSSNVGGLIGHNNGGDIDASSSAGIVTGGNRTGGLVGFFGYAGSSITNSHSSCSVFGNSEVGGLVGYSNAGFYENNYSTGAVEGTGSEVGGLIGYAAFSSLLVQQSFSTADVKGHNQVGGLIGYLQDGTLQNTFARGSVEGNNRVGGLVGWTRWGSATVANSYSNGVVFGPSGQVGGLIGRRQHSSITNSFWDTQLSGLPHSDGGSPKTTAEMLLQSTFTNAGWDFTNIWSMDPAINDGFPFLFPISSAFLFVWTGNIDTVWEKSGNWSLNQVPTATDNIIIPNVPNKPVLSSTTVVKGITIQPNSKLTINHNGALTVLQSLLNNGGQNGLVIVSDTFGTGSLIHSTANVQATFQRYIPGEPEAWHTLSSPMTAQAISPAFTPPGTYGDGTGYDLYHWHEPDTSWIYFNHPAAWNQTHGATNFLPGRGYLVAYQDTNPTLQFQGILNQGNITTAVTRTAGAADEFGFNLLGNPFPSSIDWKPNGNWSRGDLEQSAGGYNIWIWNDTAYNYGVYNSASINDQGTLGVTRYIPPTQGFFVRAAQTGSVAVNQTARVHNNAGNWLKTHHLPIAQLIVQVESLNGFGSDQVMVELGHDGTGLGAPKRFSFVPTAPALYVPVKTTPYSLRMIRHVDDHPVVPLTFQAGGNGDYKMSVAFDQTAFDYLAIEDLHTGIIHNMLENKSFSFNASTKDDNERFIIRFREGGFANPHLELPANLYTSKKMLYADLRLLDPDRQYTIAIFDITGRKVGTHALPGGKVHTLDVAHLKGILVARVNGAEGVAAFKLFF